jgi:hypothetical protein
MVPRNRGGKSSRDDGRLNAMSASMKMDPNLAAFREDRGELKRDVASLIEHIRARRRTEFRTPPAKLIGRAGAALSPTRGEKNRLLCMGAPR